MLRLALALFITTAPHLGAAENSLQIPSRGELPQPVQRHGAAVAAERLYVLGGQTPQGWSITVRSAPLLADGQLGNWRPEVALPEPRAYIAGATVGVGNKIYVAGGNTSRRTNSPDNELRKTQDVLWTQANPDGTLQPWRRSAPFPGLALSCVAACSEGKHLVLAGGSNDQDISDQVLVARLAPDGAPVDWRVAGRVPTPVWFHGAGLLRGRLYVWGGLTRRDRSSVNSRCFSVEFRDGDIQGIWRTESPMPAAVYSAGFVAGGGHLLCAGGRYANTYPTNVVWTSRLAEEDVVAPWQMFKTDLEAWVNHATAFDPRSGVVFIIGGNHQTSPTDTIGQMLNRVQAFRLAAPEP